MIQTPAEMAADAEGPTVFDSPERQERALAEAGIDPFLLLAKPENAGHGFAITGLAFASQYGGEFPRPDYEHRIYADTITANFLVIRPDANGVYWGEDKPEWERLR